MSRAPTDRHHYERAVACFEQQRWQLAITELREHLEWVPGDPLANSMIAVSLINESINNAEEAREYADAALRLGPDIVYCLYVRAVVAQYVDPVPPTPEQLRSRKPPTPQVWLRWQAIGDYANRALDRDPLHLPSLHLLAHLARWKNRPELMVDAANRALAIDPNDVDALEIRAEAQVLRGNTADACQAVDRGLTIDPERAPVHNLRGWQMLQRGEIERAAYHFSEALRFNPWIDAAHAGALQARLARFRPYRWILRFWLWRTAGRGREVGLMIVTLIVLGGGGLSKQIASPIPSVRKFGFIFLAIWSLLIAIVIICPWPLRRHREWPDDPSKSP